MDADEVVRLRKAIGKLARHFNSSATDGGLTPTQASVLALVAGHGPVSVAELVRLEHINPTMLSRVVSKLDEAGLITRTPDPDDLRSANLQATARGRERHEQIRAQRAATVSRGAERLPAREQAAIVRALPALEHLAEELQSD